MRRLAVLHSGDAIPASAIAGELKEPARLRAAEAEEEAVSLVRPVEQFLTQYFLSQGDRLPPPGVYDRIIQEVERPLISICLAPRAATRSAPPSFWASTAIPCARKSEIWGLEVIKGLRAE